MDRDTCLKAFRLLDEAAGRRKIRLEIAVYGGAAMVLRFDGREATNDLDVLVRGIDRSGMLSMSLEVGDKLGLEPGWLNQAISVFASGNEDGESFDCLDIGDNLAVYLASPRYLLAMKIMAMRTESGSHDVEDINILLDALKIPSVGKAVEIVEEYYPRETIRPGSILGLEAIFRERMGGMKEDRNLEAFKSCYAYGVIHGRADGGEPAADGMGGLSDEDRKLVDRRCRLFMEKAEEAGIGQDWNSEMWATAGDVLSDRDGNLSICGRDFSDDCGQHDFTEDEAGRADAFLGKFLRDNPMDDNDFEALFSSPENPAPGAAL